MRAQARGLLSPALGPTTRSLSHYSSHATPFPHQSLFCHRIFAQALPSVWYLLSPNSHKDGPFPPGLSPKTLPQRCPPPTNTPQHSAQQVLSLPPRSPGTLVPASLSFSFLVVSFMALSVHLFCCLGLYSFISAFPGECTLGRKGRNFICPASSPVPSASHSAVHPGESQCVFVEWITLD